MKIGKITPKIGNQEKILLLFFFSYVIRGPISGPIWFPISGPRPETYFLAGRLDTLPYVRFTKSLDSFSSRKMARSAARHGATAASVVLFFNLIILLLHPLEVLWSCGGDLKATFRLFKVIKKLGEAFFTYSWSFFLTVKLLCLQSLKALSRRTFPL